jgi:hypothetical protein
MYKRNVPNHLVCDAGQICRNELVGIRVAPKWQLGYGYCSSGLSDDTPLQCDRHALGVGVVQLLHILERVAGNSLLSSALVVDADNAFTFSQIGHRGRAAVNVQRPRSVPRSRDVGGSATTCS